MVNVRQRYTVFGRGSMEFLHPTNPKILAYLRRDARDTILVVLNLSRYVQPAELDLREFRGCVPVELIGGTRFPSIGELPYFFTLGPHTFYWFRLDPPAGP